MLHSAKAVHAFAPSVAGCAQRRSGARVCWLRGLVSQPTDGLFLAVQPGLRASRLSCTTRIAHQCIRVRATAGLLVLTAAAGRLSCFVAADSRRFPHGQAFQSRVYEVRVVCGPVVTCGGTGASFAVKKSRAWWCSRNLLPGREKPYATRFPSFLVSYYVSSRVAERRNSLRRSSK